MNDLMIIKTISNNDGWVMAVKLSHDGNFIASICEDDINKKHLIEVYDFDYNDSNSMSSTTLYSQSEAYTYEKGLTMCVAWNPKKNVLAITGGDKEGGMVHILNPVTQVIAAV